MCGMLFATIDGAAVRVPRGAVTMFAPSIDPHLLHTPGLPRNCEPFGWAGGRHPGLARAPDPVADRPVVVDDPDFPPRPLGRDGRLTASSIEAGTPPCMPARRTFR